MPNGTTQLRALLRSSLVSFYGTATAPVDILASARK
jgi:hypothetical protein